MLRSTANEAGQAASPARRGRPRDPERLQRILNAAARQFHEQGLPNTSMDAIAAEAGVSKMTVYSHFPSKEALFIAAVASRSAELMGSEMPSMDPLKPKQALMAIGRAFLRLIRDDQVVQHHRILFGLRDAHPEVRQAFHDDGPDRMRQALAAYLAQATRQGSLHVRHPDLAADQFMGLFLGMGQLRHLLNLGKPSAQEDEALLKANVALFIKGHGPG